MKNEASRDTSVSRLGQVFPDRPVAYEDRPADTKLPAPATRVAAGYSAGDEGIDLWKHLDLLWKGRLWIVAGTLLFIGLAAVYTSMRPRLYRTTASVFVTPPTYATTLRPETLSVEAYEKLAESEFVLGRVQTQLHQSRPDLFGGAGASGGWVTYDARLYISREPMKPYLPLLDLTAIAESPERAQLAANMWANIFVTEQGNLSKVGKSSSADFIISQLPETEKALSQHEFQVEVVLRRQTEAVSKLESALGLSLKKAEAEAYEKTVVSLEDILSRAMVELNHVKPTVAELTAELARTPTHIEVSRAITDDALWAVLTGQADKKAIEALPELRLRTMEINIIHSTLRMKLAEERVKYLALIPHIASLEKQIAQTQKKVGEFRAALFDGERKVADLKRTHEVEVAERKRSVATSKFAFDKLAEKFGEAKIAKFEPDNDLKLGALAALPAGPFSPNIPLNLIIAAVFGFVASLVSVWFASLVADHRRELAAAVPAR